MLVFVSLLLVRGLCAWCSFNSCFKFGLREVVEPLTDWMQRGNCWAHFAEIKTLALSAVPSWWSFHSSCFQIYRGSGVIPIPKKLLKFGFDQGATVYCGRDLTCTWGSHYSLLYHKQWWCVCRFSHLLS